MLAVIGVLAGCKKEEAVDPRFESVDATLATMMRAYGVEEMTQDEIQAHMRTQGRFELRDEATYQACFLDYRGPQDEGLAGFVFGMLAAGKDQLQVRTVDDRSTVFPTPGRVDRSVVLFGRNGEWTVSLEESVPGPIREALRGEYERSSNQRRREIEAQ
jgi:hypothetical protein